jgi:hypothetical protein
MGTDLVPYKYPPGFMKEAQAMGIVNHTSGAFGVNTASQGSLIAITMIVKGLTPIEYLERYHTIQGKPSMRSDRMYAELLQAGAKVTIVSRSPDGSSLDVEHRGNKHRFSFSWEEAQLEPFVREKDGKTLKKNWRTPRAREQMMWARVISDATRTMEPGICCGLYTPEEVSDFTPSGASADLPESPTVATSGVIALTPPVNDTEDTKFEPAVTADAGEFPPKGQAVSDSALPATFDRLAIAIASIEPKLTMEQWCYHKDFASLNDITESIAQDSIQKIEAKFGRVEATVQ